MSPFGVGVPLRTDAEIEVLGLRELTDPELHRAADLLLLHLGRR
jgi:hypothetical protein